MSDYCDQPEIYNEKRIIARKEHRCDECDRIIPKGTTYVRCSGKWDGDFSIWRQHVECRDFAAKVNLDFIGYCLIPFGGVEDAMRNHREYDLPDHLAQEWERVKVLYPEARKG